MYRLLQGTNEGTPEILDAACGTGNYTLALEIKGCTMTGVDVSEEMLRKARSKSEDIRWIQSDIRECRFHGKRFDGVTCILSIHHFEDLSSSIKNLYHVLKSGGRLVIFTSTPEQMANYWLNAYFPEMMEKSMEQMPSFEMVSSALTRAGFFSVETEPFLIRPSLEDFFLYSGKSHPELYLDGRMRSGISSFANLVSENELEKGLQLLASDLHNGNFGRRTEAFDRRQGDYLFVIAEKRDSNVT
ncbi:MULTISPECIES: class I SAM-dependent methyltransferase [Bacillaceae]|uniref:class I SAM-dependent methyltransferase n=1 Tax=Alteribacter populi TaxID=2011011 RepID=UPI000BBAB5BE|nr:class I SAM-dependent methyltransferase [Alteribacter populi]